MRASLTWILAACIAGCGVDTAESDAALTTGKLDARLQPIAFVVGTYTCLGTYEDLPPFTFAHQAPTVIAFTPSHNGQWLTAQFQEFQTPGNPHPASSIDHITLDLGSSSTGLR